VFHNGTNGANGGAAIQLPETIRRALAERIERLTDRGNGGATRCHHWRGNLHNPGARAWPRLMIAKRGWSVRQLVWLAAFGSLPAHRARVYRTCSSPDCVNPLHLTLSNPRRRLVANGASRHAPSTSRAPWLALLAHGDPVRIARGKSWRRSAVVA